MSVALLAGVQLMFINARAGAFVLVALLCAVAVSAQQAGPPTPSVSGKITLDVVVTPKSGAPVAGLRQQDFTLLDNKLPQTITSFEAVTGRQAPLEIVLVIDAVNTDYEHIGYERAEINKFLRSDEGRLEYPVALVTFTDQAVQIVGGFSTDGNALSATLDRVVTGFRVIGRDAGFYGATERLQMSLNAMHQLVASEAVRPERKLMLWVSPGWPLLAGPSSNDLDSTQKQGIFSEIANFSTQLRQANVTLYSLDPLGAGESLGIGLDYQNFLKGVSKPSQAFPGNLALQVLAIQSGGLAFNFTNGIAGPLRQCIAGAGPYYEITFDPPPAKQRDEYHHLEIKLAKSGLTARTRQGYYAQP
jgi:VWFA-related protein